jgi:hypothetical protein
MRLLFVRVRSQVRGTDDVHRMIRKLAGKTGEAKQRFLITVSHFLFRRYQVAGAHILCSCRSE